MASPPGSFPQRADIRVQPDVHGPAKSRRGEVAVAASEIEPGGWKLDPLEETRLDRPEQRPEVRKFLQMEAKEIGRVYVGLRRRLERRVR